MTFLDILLAAYVVLAMVATVMTYREQRQSQIFGLVRCLIGLMASVAWPLPLSAMIACKTLGYRAGRP